MGMLEFPTNAGEIASYFNAELLGDPNATVEGLSSVQTMSPGMLCYLSDRKVASLLGSLPPGAVVLTKKEFVNQELPLTYLLVEEPKVVFANLAKTFLPKTPWKGISRSAEIHPLAEIDPSAHVGPFAVVCEGAKIGPNTVIFPHAYVGPGVEIGANCEIHSQVVLLVRVKIGNRVRVLSGSVLGSDGFGLIEGEKGHLEMPQVGSVIIEDDVRIGSHCTIDRGTLGETRVGCGSKLDDQVHLGHNCQIGKNVILCAQVGLSGSVVVEEGAVLGGQVGVGSHLKIGKGARVGGQTGVTADLKGGETYFSTPALPLRQALRAHVFFRDLPDLAERLNSLEKEIHGKTKS
jgi:UDP-3-O-[3-hydroxymyristoyl] glucosamine N-acyltransferase